MAKGPRSISVQNFLQRRCRPSRNFERAARCAPSLVSEQVGRSGRLERMGRSQPPLGGFPPLPNNGMGLQIALDKRNSGQEILKGKTSMTAQTKPPFRADHVG